ncbi:hypothetical protein DNU06_16400 [Putridiphycobacter roseus]|uniref:PNPLA domain-containing protein n=1 Tax=Putridiphycobacter roseus TaxID=2219161 RepID=A0A2W1MVB3_9FLAO|nr:patatin-like phospholipase family protein [Putridiphycobacter roseus]PZE15757.1 hypothetical protein DNU06_16400 [Putridiphycobacter roseus]
MKKMLSILLIFYSFFGMTQKIGLVFSGGGATGFAHIGVLKALEENNIPIDYITGTSAGALVGALYASGLSPLQIEAIAKSEKFFLMSQGLIEEEYKFYLHNADIDAELLSIKLSKDSIIQKSLPTNLLNSTYLDLELLHLLGVNPSATNNSFDSLFIPFRCIASDITTKESITFRKGSLNMAVRASMAYPFFLSPVKLDGRLLFDGGLYNNFPANSLLDEFNIDFIIGSNVSYNEPPPLDDDLMSQVRNLFSQHSNYNLPCENGVIISPDLGNIGTFDFDQIDSAIAIGYQAALLKVDSIKSQIFRIENKEDLKARRKKYLDKKIKFSFDAIETTGINANESAYINRKLMKLKKENGINYETLKYRYLKLYQSDYIHSFSPSIEAYKDSTQTLGLYVRKEKPLKASFGGHFSSRPVNTGFLKLSYNDFKITPVSVYANAYFGNFYGSIKTGLKLHLPTKNETYIEPMYSRSRWDYFTNFAIFFEDVQPSFLILDESFWGVKYNVEVATKGKLEFSFKNGVNNYEYYQSSDYLDNDTVDVTSMLFYSPGIKYTRNTFNRKSFESSGSLFEISSRYVHAIENTVPGSTSPNNISQDNTFRNWVYLDLKYVDYFLDYKNYRLGFYLEGYYAYKPNLHNYTVSKLSAQNFNPFPDAQTVYYEDYRSNEYAAIGLINIFTLKDKLDLRIEAYLFQPLKSMLNENGETSFSKPFASRFELASASLIYHSFVGPIRATVNYYGQQEKPLSLQLSYGYVLFNERSVK